MIDIIGGVMLSVTILLTMFNVFGDWVFDKKFGEIDELTLAAFVWVVYIGMGELYKSGEHIRVDLLEKLLHEKANRILRIYIDVIDLIVSVAVTYYAVVLTIRSITKYTAILKIPYFYIDMAVVIGFASLVIYAIIDILKNTCGIKQKKDGDVT
jgi:TRAP-type C4-dicarboxylate transport system permease small subunit